ncbi:MAG TPA: phosphate ABC transporter substrate-binding protein [Ignavibacteriales bacterium]|nr:phosphate ABC transporter substrate-binding protein [Ignavibacteriales bacterium]
MKQASLRYIYIAFILMLSSCGGSNPDGAAIVKIKGSDTMLMINRALAREFMKERPNIAVYAEGGGTKSGIESLIKGNADIGAASRSIRADETKALAENYNAVGISFLIAKDALSIYLNPDNPVTGLTLEQLKDIYTGKIKNWKDVGGPDAPIKLLSRPPNSGTYLYFKEHVLEGEEYSGEIAIMPTTEDIVKETLRDKNAIGYGGIGYGAQLRHCKINGISPIEENVRNDKYPIIRYLYYYPPNTPKNAVKEFIDWTLGPKGQAVIKAEGYIAIWK